MKALACQKNNTKAYMTQSMTKGLQCIIGRFQTRSAIWKFSDVRESIQLSKRMDWLFFFIFSVLEAKIFQHGFLDEHKVRLNNRY